MVSSVAATSVIAVVIPPSSAIRMRFSIFNILMLFVATAALLAWLIDKSRLEKVIANYGEYQPESHWEEISDGDIADLISIGELSFVYCYSDISFDEISEPDIKDLGLPVDAVRQGFPKDVLIDSINELLGSEHEYHLENATATAGDGYLYWKITWSLFPIGMGFSGVPYEYIGYVRPDGSAVPPRMYLRDYYGAWYDNQDDLLFSVLPIEKLRSATNQSVDESKLVEIATQHLSDSLNKLEVKTQFRFDGIRRRTFSPKLLSTSSESRNELEVWAVDFVDSSIPQSTKNVNSATRITVWITSDFEKSTISVGKWQLDKR